MTTFQGHVTTTHSNASYPSTLFLRKTQTDTEKVIRKYLHLKVKSISLDSILEIWNSTKAKLSKLHNIVIMSTLYC